MATFPNILEEKSLTPIKQAHADISLTEDFGIEGVTGINCLDCLRANSSSLCVLIDNYSKNCLVRSV